MRVFLPLPYIFSIASFGMLVKAFFDFFYFFLCEVSVRASRQVFWLKKIRPCLSLPHTYYYTHFFDNYNPKKCQFLGNFVTINCQKKCLTKIPDRGTMENSARLPVKRPQTSRPNLLLYHMHVGVVKGFFMKIFSENGTPGSVCMRRQRPLVCQKIFEKKTESFQSFFARCFVNFTEYSAPL